MPRPSGDLGSGPCTATAPALGSSCSEPCWQRRLPIATADPSCLLLRAAAATSPSCGKRGHMGPQGGSKCNECCADHQGAHPSPSAAALPSQPLLMPRQPSMVLDCLYCSACLPGSMIHNHTLAQQPLPYKQQRLGSRSSSAIGGSSSRDGCSSSNIYKTHAKLKYIQNACMEHHAKCRQVRNTLSGRQASRECRGLGMGLRRALS